ncbi:molybdate ABC transporter substrate-binding protein [Sedimenticola thiotaurini]|uniref:Molybdate ABC transporter substrate-binding protein n=1 Tax=Sedimenticola thiotaurini TaxID=1543721 RepID=A0A0F7JXP7_9GAMM|nr:molybdate ABC transporter substrate-binding protein [Sedimenticola thiotaurini]AKH19418.1 hypothetical protein AAY24_02590 [Sedimenticola thiotaurini]
MPNPIRRIGGALWAICASLSINAVQAQDLTIAAANSTCNAIKAVGQQYSQNHAVNIRYICKSSGLLAKGIRGRAIRADIYISANRAWMDYMIKAGLVTADKVASPWGNRLVVSAPANSPLKFDTWKDLMSDPVKTIFIGDPGTAPFGRYAKQAMQKSGIWEQVKQKITTQKHITLLADTLAESGGHSVGILFATNLTPQLRILHPVDPSLHPAIRYYMAPLENETDMSGAMALADYINSDAAKAVFETAGFVVESL